MLDLYREERGRGVHENGVPLSAIRELCDEYALEGQDRHDLSRHFVALDLVWLDWREKARAAERAKAQRESKTPKNRRR